MSVASLPLESPAAATRAASAYRPDIDGLRAVAVLSVVATHLGLAGFAGGFLGVDIFFVISGYLITRNLEASQGRGWRGLADFYTRRMRRTMPALYLVTLATAICAALLLLPGELDDFARSVVATVLFVPNLFFLSETDYFAHAAASKPLLHTWSLGVEEQFYLVAPLIPLALRRLGRRGRGAALLGLLLASLLLCAILQRSAAPAAFFLMPTRLWEFVVGGMIAERVLPPVRSDWLAEALAAAALVALGGSIYAFSAATAHPGLPTLIPCVATAALIHVGTGRRTLVGRLLGCRPMAGIGLISYSIYLWHWPMIRFGRLLDLPETPAALLAGFGLLIGLSTLSWRFVEVPFRAPGTFPRRHALRILAPGAALLAGLGFVTVWAHGFPQRFTPAVASVASYYDYANRRDFREGTCFITSKYGDVRYFDRRACLTPSTGKPNLLVIGDSHGAHLWAGLHAVFPDWNVMQATASGCKPLLPPSGKTYCTDLIRQVMTQDLPRMRPKPDVILLGSVWGTEDLAPLETTMRELAAGGTHVIVMGRMPGHNEALPTLLARATLEGKASLVRDHQEGAPFDIDRAFKAALPPDAYFSATDLLCPHEDCRVYAGPGIPLQFDTDHLTTEGSILVAEGLRASGLVKR